MMKTTKKAVVVLALCLIGFIQVAANSLTLESDVMPDVEERINALLGEHRVAPLLQALQTKVAGLPAAEAGELVRDVQIASAEFVKFEDQCRNRTRDYVELTNEYNLSYHKVLEQLLLKHKSLNATLEDLAKSEAALLAANNRNAELERRLQEVMDDLAVWKSGSRDGPTNLREQLAQRDKQVDQFKMEKEVLQKDFQLCKEQNNHTFRGPDVEESISRLTLENENLKRQLKESNETKALEDLRAQLEKALQNITTMNNNSDELEISQKKISLSFTDLYQNMKAEKLKHKKELAALRAEKQQCLENSANLTTTLNRTSQELEECLNEKQNASYKSDLCKDLARIVDKQTDEITELNNDLDTALENVIIKNQEVERLQAELAEMMDNVNRLTSDNKKKEEDVKSITDVFETFQSHCNKEKQLAQVKIASLEAEKQQCLENSGTLTTLNQTSQDLEECLNREQNNSSNSAMCEELALEVQQLMDETKELTNDLNKALQNELNKNKEVERLQAELAEMMDNVNRLTSDNTKKEEDIKSITGVFEIFQNHSNKEKQLAQVKIASLEAEKQQCLENSANLTTLNQTSQYLEECLNRKQNNSSNSAMCEDLAREVQQLMNETQELTNDLDKALQNELNKNKEVERLQAELAEMMDNVNRLTSDNTKKEEDIKSITGVFETFQNHSNKEKQLAQVKIASLEAEKQQCLENSANLTTTLNQTSQELEHYQQANQAGGCNKTASANQDLIEALIKLQKDSIVWTSKLNDTTQVCQNNTENTKKLAALVHEKQVVDESMKAVVERCREMLINVSKDLDNERIQNAQLEQALINKSHQVDALIREYEENCTNHGGGGNLGRNITHLMEKNEMLSAKLKDALEEIAVLRKSLHDNPGSSANSDNITKAIEMLTNIEGALGLLPDSGPIERPLPQSCAEAMEQAGSDAASGVYQLFLPESGLKPFYVYCLKDPGCGAAWTVIQHRSDNSTNFYREWNEYKQGFGNLRNEFFIGLDKLNALTQVQLQELRVEMVDFDDQTRYAMYDNFAIGDANEQYALNILGQYEGNAGDSLRRQQGQKFSTADNDNDASDENCAETYAGAWWYEACQDSNLNGLYLPGNLSKDQYGQGIVWSDWHGQYYSLKSVYMAIRPKV